MDEDEKYQKFGKGGVVAGLIHSSEIIRLSFKFKLLLTVISTESVLQSTDPENGDETDPLITEVDNPKQPPREGVDPIEFVMKLNPGGA